MIKKFSDSLYERLEKQLHEIEKQKTSPLGRFSQSVKIASDAIVQLSGFVKEHAFEDTAEEIGYHKQILPKFVAVKLYETLLFTIEKRKPMDSELALRIYLLDELAYIRRWLMHNEFAHNYYKMQLSEYDSYYFLSKREVPHIDFPELIVETQELECPMGYAFARIIAYEKLEKLLMEQLRQTNFMGNNGLFQRVNRPLKWTGKNVDLAEVIYGLYFSGCINNGAVTIIDIVRGFEEVFQVQFPKFYRCILDIKRRKILSYTQFLDKMQKGIKQHIDDENSLENMKRESRRFGENYR